MSDRDSLLCRFDRGQTIPFEEITDLVDVLRDRVTEVEEENEALKGRCAELDARLDELEP